MRVGDELPGALTILCDINITRAHLLPKEDTGACGRRGNTSDGAHSPSKYAQDTNDYSCPRLLHGAAILEDASWKRIARSTYNPVRY
ncbi:hypothetical protein CDAR_519221 [Caerostris darwini]|uniref:Uncharacterized protein n=1 Tax=Caerostris darwini TaxID=1538125 RepID=A0AAV4PPX6_9ARAC|nr:hypothetical protein CDAR_519221 [Caerostris darwini]